MANEVYSHGRPVNAGSNTNSPGKGFMVACATPGYVRMQFNDGSTMDIYAVTGSAEFRDYGAVGFTIPAGSSADVRITILD